MLLLLALNGARSACHMPRVSAAGCIMIQHIIIIVGQHIVNNNPFSRNESINLRQIHFYRKEYSASLKIQFNKLNIVVFPLIMLHLTHWEQKMVDFFMPQSIFSSFMRNIFQGIFASKLSLGKTMLGQLGSARFFIN